MQACAIAYERQTGIPVRLSGGGSTLGIEAAATAGADLGGTCRACLSSRGEDKLEVKLAIIAWDALVVVTHPNNPVSNLTKKQVRDVLQQTIKNWQEVGGGDSKIVVVARRGKTSGVGYLTRLLMFGDVQADYGPSVIRLNSTGPVEGLVEKQPRSIAVTSVSSARKRKLKILSIDGVHPTAENISTGAYPFYRPLYLAFKPTNLRASRFIDWILSEKGQAIVEQEGTVSLEQGSRLVHRFQHFENPSQIVNLEALR